MKVVLKPLYHRGIENIAIIYPNDAALNNLVKKLKNVKWSQTNKCWYLPMNERYYQLINERLKPVAAVDDSLLKQYLQKKKAVEATYISPTPLNQGTISAPVSPAWKLSKENLAALQKFVEVLKLKAYSTSTIKTYRNEFLQLLQLLKKKPVSDLTPDDLRRYFLYCLEKSKLTENTLHSRINATKFYFEQVLGREKFFWEIPRPKKKDELPKLFNQDEVAAIINSTTNKSIR